MPADPDIVAGVRAVLEEHLGMSQELGRLRQEVAQLATIMREVLELQRRETVAREAALALAKERREEEHAAIEAREVSWRRRGAGLTALGVLLASVVAIAREVLAALKGP